MNFAHGCSRCVCFAAKIGEWKWLNQVMATFVLTFVVCLGVWEASSVANLFMLFRRAVNVKQVPSIVLIFPSGATIVCCLFSIRDSVLPSRICIVLARNTKFLTICAKRSAINRVRFAITNRIRCHTCSLVLKMLEDFCLTCSPNSFSKRGERSWVHKSSQSLATYTTERTEWLRTKAALARL